MKTVLVSLLNKNIGLYLNDSQFVEGVLLSILQDHIALDVNGKVCFFSIEHIQALSKNAKDNRIFPRSIHDFRDRFANTLKALKYNWVTINGLSNQAHFGVLSSIMEDYIQLINKEEILYIAKTAISNIHQGMSDQEITFISNNDDQNIETKVNESISEVDEQYFVSSIIDEVKQVDEEPVETTSMVEQRQEETDVVTEFPTVPLLTESIEKPYKEEEQFTLVKAESMEIENVISDENSIMIEQLLERLKSIVQSMDSGESVNDLVEIEDNQLDQADLLTTYKENEQLLIEDAQTLPSESPGRKNEKRILLTPWSKMSFDQNATNISPKKNNEIEFSPNFNSPFGSKPSLKVSKSAIEEKHDFPLAVEVNNDEQSSTLIEDSENTESIAPQAQSDLISPRERKAMIEKQYFALMRHAEQNWFNTDHNEKKNKDQESEESKKLQIIGQQEGEKVMLEKQFYSLMRHAAKMYRQLRDY